MKALLVLCLVGIALASLAEDQSKFAEFKAQYARSYVSAEEESAKFAIFQTNLREAERLQARNPTATFGVTMFMDISAAEFKKTHLNLDGARMAKWHSTLKSSKQLFADNDVTFHQSVDWQSKKNPKNCVAVSDVEDQGQCGSCWAFSAAEALEGCVMIKHGDSKQVQVAPQQLVDCCTAGASAGCDGGYPDLCLDWAVNQTMYTDGSYPYYAEDGTCHVPKKPVVASTPGMCEFVSIPSENETALQVALQNGPVSICIYGDPLQYYLNGIIIDCYATPDMIDHAVLLTTQNDDIYSIKNSWADQWGESGYFRVFVDENCLQLSYEASMAVPAQ